LSKFARKLQTERLIKAQPFVKIHENKDQETRPNKEGFKTKSEADQIIKLNQKIKPKKKRKQLQIRRKEKSNSTTQIQRRRSAKAQTIQGQDEEKLTITQEKHQVQKAISRSSSTTKNEKIKRPLNYQVRTREIGTR